MFYFKRTIIAILLLAIILVSLYSQEQSTLNLTCSSAIPEAGRHFDSFLSLSLATGTNKVGAFDVTIYYSSGQIVPNLNFGKAGVTVNDADYNVKHGFDYINITGTSDSGIGTGGFIRVQWVILPETNGDVRFNLDINTLKDRNDTSIAYQINNTCYLSVPPQNRELSLECPIANPVFQAGTIFRTQIVFDFGDIIGARNFDIFIFYDSRQIYPDFNFSSGKEGVYIVTHNTIGTEIASYDVHHGLDSINITGESYNGATGGFITISWITIKDSSNPSLMNIDINTLTDYWNNPIKPRIISECDLFIVPELVPDSGSGPSPQPTPGPETGLPTGAVFYPDDANIQRNVNANLAMAKNNNPNNAYGDPVIITSGAFHNNKTDLSYKYINSEVAIDRNYNNQIEHSGSFGKGWSFNYDTRIISGLHPDDSLADEMILGDVNGDTKITITDSLLIAQYYVGFGNNFINLYVADVNFDGVINIIDSLLIAQHYVTFITSFPGEENWVSPVPLLNALNNSLKIKDTIVSRFDNEEFYTNTGIGTVTLIDEQGIPRLYYIDDEPNFDSNATYANGEKNYYPSGSSCSSKLPNKETLTLLPDGGYKRILADRKIILYNYYGQLTQIQDLNGNKLYFEYDEDQNLSLIRDDFNRETQFVYDSHRIIQITNPLNDSWFYSYDSEGKLQGVTDPEGDTTTYSYDENRIIRITKPDASYREFIYEAQDDTYRVTQTIDEMGNSEYFDYHFDENYVIYTNPSGIAKTIYFDTHKNIIGEQYPDDSFIEKTYNIQNDLATYLDQEGYLKTYWHDENHNITRAYDDLNYYSEWTYNEYNKITSHTDKLLNTTNFSYDSNGNLELITYPDNNTKSYSYYPNGLLESQTDENGNTISYHYDSNGYLSQKEDAEGNIEYFTYDATGNLTHFTDAEGHIFEYQYNSLGQKVKTIYPIPGMVEEWTYDERKDLVSTKNRRGYTTQIQYDDRHKPVTIINPKNEYAYNVYRPDGQISEISINDTHTQYDYDELGRLNSIFQVETENLLRFDYDKKGQLILKVNADGGEKKYEYNYLGKISKAWDEDNNVTLFIYNERGDLIQQQDAKGNLTNFDYNERGWLSKITDPYGFTTIYHYYPKGNLESITDKEGKQIHYGYDKNNRLSWVKQNDITLKQQIYNARGLLEKVIDANGNETSYGYDEIGRLIEITNAQGKIKTFTYDMEDNLLSETDEKGNTTQYSYDELNRLSSVTNANNEIVKQIEYNYLGLPDKITDSEGGEWNYQYNELGQLSYENDADGQWKEYHYNGRGLLKQKNIGGLITDYDYDQRGYLTAITDSVNQIYNYEYDENGNKVSEYYTGQTPYIYEYDKLNRLIKETNPLEYEKSYSYTPESRIKNISDFNNQIISYSYDEFNNLDIIEYANEEVKDYDYDLTGRLTGIENQTGRLDMTYNELNQLVEINDSINSQIIQLAYDDVGNRKQITWDDGNKVIDYTYGKINELMNLTGPEGYSTFGYDTLGREITRSLPNGVSVNRNYYNNGQIKSIITHNPADHILDSVGYVYNQAGKLIYELDQHGRFTQYQYDAAGRIEVAHYPFGQGKELEDFEARLKAGIYPSMNEDAAGPDLFNEPGALRISVPEMQNQAQELLNKLSAQEEVYRGYTGEVAQNGTWNITPESGAPAFIQTAALDGDIQTDLENLLREISTGSTLNPTQNLWSEGFTYDNTNNLTDVTNGWGNISYTYDTGNRLSTMGNRSYNYDHNGNMTEEILGSLSVLYEYTQDNRLKKSLNLIDGLIGEAAEVQYQYDGLGRRVIQQNYSTDGTLVNTINSIFDGFDFKVLEENSDASSYINNYANGTLIARTGNNGSLYYSHDRQGSVRTTTNQNASLMENYRYSAFGAVYAGTLNSEQPFGYNGKALNPLTAAYNYGFRDYRPDLGRFTTIDPIMDGLNWYAYVGNDPLNFIDPYGLYAEDIIIPFQTGVQDVLFPSICQFPNTGFDPLNFVLQGSAGVYNVAAGALNSIQIYERAVMGLAYNAVENAYNYITKSVIGQEGVTGDGLSGDADALFVYSMCYPIEAQAASYSVEYIVTAGKNYAQMYWAGSAASGASKFSQGLVNEIVTNSKSKFGGNVTVMKNGNPVFRVHQPGSHGNINATLTRFEQGVNPNNGRVFNIPSKKVSNFLQDDLDILEKALKNVDGFSIRTKKGR